ncbi:MAG: DUF2147 domain-containing protein [Taibaiella sp.]|nr:DUF2147 domain-containing protein [Taibaiella sp.]
MRLIVFVVCCCLPSLLLGQKTNDRNAILGRWLITPKKNLIVNVYLSGSQYRAKIVWFSNPSNPVPPDKRLDDKNPIVALRSRKIMGSDVLQDITYNESSNRWEGGKIYDATSGKTWSAAAYINKAGNLVVRGYWGFEIFGRSLIFIRPN